MKIFLKVLGLVLTLALVVSVISLINIYIPGGLIFIGSFAIGWWMGDISIHINRMVDAHYESKKSESTVIHWDETSKEEEEE